MKRLKTPPVYASRPFALERAARVEAVTVARERLRRVVEEDA